MRNHVARFTDGDKKFYIIGRKRWRLNYRRIKIPGDEIGKGCIVIRRSKLEAFTLPLKEKFVTQ